MKTLRWTQPTESGLCDRLVDILILLTYARVFGCRLAFQWPGFKAKDIDTAHRTQDIKIENVLKYMRFPNDLLPTTDASTSCTFNKYLGGYCDLGLFHRTYLEGECTFERFMEFFEVTRKDFGFNEEITTFLTTIPADFVSFHIRRGDKVRQENGDGTFIHERELDELNRLTYKAFDQYLNAGVKMFFICSDQDEKKVEFVEYVKSNGAGTFDLPVSLQKWQTTYYDIAVMSKSQNIVTSNRHSSFSRFPAMIGNGKVDTVYSLEANRK